MAGKIVGALVVFALVAAAAASGWFYTHPLDVMAWAGRRELVKAGFGRASWETPVGRQTGFVAGTGPVVVILLHGAGDQAGTWASVAPLIVKGRRVVAIDLAGHGGSEPRKGPISVAAAAGALDAVLAKEAPEGGAVLVGNSLGAWVAFLAAGRHPERVARIVAVNGGPLKGTGASVRLLPRTREEARQSVAALRDPASLAVPGFVLDDIVRKARKGPLARLAMTAGEMDSLVLDGKLSAFAVPVSILWGESDRLMPPEYARRLQGELPGATLKTLPRCGHIPQVECPQALAAALAQILGSP